MDKSNNWRNINVPYTKFSDISKKEKTQSHWKSSIDKFFSNTFFFLKNIIIKDFNKLLLTCKI